MLSSMRTLENLIYARPAGHELPLNLYLPDAASGPLPVVVWLPGGGWRHCNNDSSAAFLCEHGFAVASIRYRLSAEAIAPANVRDCKTAVRWVRAHAAEYGLDPERIGVFGASAGGHLAALLTLTSGKRELEPEEHDGHSSDVRCGVDFCGPSDLTRIAQSQWQNRFGLLYDVTRDYLGGPVSERTKLAELVSPLRYVTKGHPPLFIVHGSRDETVPLEESIELYNASHALDNDVTLHIIPEGGHSWDWNLTNERVAAFFKCTLA
jgi:acetyl esterase/lipase